MKKKSIKNRISGLKLQHPRKKSKKNPGGGIWVKIAYTKFAFAKLAFEKYAIPPQRDVVILTQFPPQGVKIATSLLGESRLKLQHP